MSSILIVSGKKNFNLYRKELFFEILLELKSRKIKT